MTNQTNDVIRDAKQLGIPKMLILGLQHMFAMFGATILVPILCYSMCAPGSRFLHFLDLPLLSSGDFQQ